MTCFFRAFNKLRFYSSPKKEDEDEMLKYAERFKITHLLDKKFGEISGGERQIVSICSAIIQDTTSKDKTSFQKD